MTKKSKNGTTISIDVENSSTTSQGGGWWKLVLILLLMVGAFFGGRKSMGNVEPIEQPPIYIPGDTVKIEVPKPVPVSVKVPADTADIIAECVASGKYWELFPEKVRDSISYVPIPQDTLEIIRDWATARMYEEKVFDVDTLGTATVKALVQYNRLEMLSADVVPAVKNVPYIIPPKKISPFVGAGFNSASCVSVSGGVFVNEKWGGLVTYQKDINAKTNIVGAEILYKF